MPSSMMMESSGPPRPPGAGAVDAAARAGVREFTELEYACSTEESKKRLAEYEEGEVEEEEGKQMNEPGTWLTGIISARESSLTLAPARSPGGSWV